MTKQLLAVLIVASVITIALYVLSSVAPISTCVSIYDNYAYEIVLNKPGIKYNMNLLLKEYVRQENYYVKISDIDKRIQIIISEMNLEDLNLGLGKALDLRFQIRSEFLPKPAYMIVFRIEGVISNLKPEYSIISNNSTVYIYRYDKNYIDITILKINPKMPIDDFVNKSREEAANAFNVPLENVIMLKREYVRISIADINDISWYDVVFHELNNLVVSGAIKNLSSSDIEYLSAMASPGFAGWNSRIVFEGNWKPYYETSNPKLLRCVIDSYFVNTVEGKNIAIPKFTSTPAPLATSIAQTTTTTGTMEISTQEPLKEDTGTFETATYRTRFITPMQALALMIMVGMIASLIVWFILKRLLT